MLKKFLVFLAFATAFCLAADTLAVTDDADILYVGSGEEYTLDGTHSYNQYVNIEGTLYVTAYNGSGTTGTLELIAPEITVSGIINGNGLGYRTAEGPGAIDTYPGGGGAYGGDGGASGWGNPGGTAYGTADGSDIQMGSGGANQTLGVGGPGGASVSLSADTLTISGSIIVNGNQGSDVTGWGDGGGGGAGGGILIEATIATISGTLSADGGRGGNSVQRRGGGGGGGGRIKIFYGELNPGGSLVTYSGGAGGIGGWPANGTAGGAGTYYTEQMIVDNDDYLIVPGGKEYYLHGTHEYNQYVLIDGTLYVDAYNGSGDTGTITLVSPDVTVNGQIDADGKGYRGSEGPGKGESPGGPAGGAGYGGNGGDSCCDNAEGGPSYGTADGNDIEKGSGGGNGIGPGGTGYGGKGGGCVILNSTYTIINGTITANGLTGETFDRAPGGGSGGGILIQSSQVSITGTLSVAGGNGGNGIWAGGGGAGGRIKIFYGCYIDDSSANIVLTGGAGGTGSWNGLPGESGTYYTESDIAAPFRGYEATYQRWEFLIDIPFPPADVVDNPYGDPTMEVFSCGPWFPVWGGREGVWPLSGIIDVNIPNRPDSGPHSMKIVWLQIVWAPSDPGFLDAEPIVHENSTGIAIEAAKYPDCVLEEFEEDGVPRNWINSNYVIVMKPNPKRENIMIEGIINVDRIIVETICIPGLRTGDLNGDGKVDFADLAIFANHWLDGTE